MHSHEAGYLLKIKIVNWKSKMSEKGNPIEHLQPTTNVNKKRHGQIIFFKVQPIIKHCLRNQNRLSPNQMDK